MIGDEQSKRGWGLRLVAVAIAATLLGLACENSNQDVIDPADVKNSQADKLIPCFASKPCTAGLTCVGGLCMFMDGGVTPSTGNDATDSKGATGSPGLGPTQAQRKLQRQIPCQSPQGLAFDGSSLWCVDLSSGLVAKRFSLYNANPSATLIMPNVNIKDIGRDISSSQLMVADTTGWVWRVKSSSPQQQKVVNVGSVFGVAFGADSQILVVEGNQVTHRNATSLGKESSASVPNSYCTMLAYAYSQFYRHCGVQGSGSSQYHRVQLFSDTAPNATFVRELPASVFATGQGGMEVHTTTLWIIGTGSGTDKGFMVEFLLK